ncbi:MAG TPA: MBL fold metallo-hydrolase [Ktedonobacterales bacterium]|nr:MBL fold metallo-hydrolase [Ktedonobacterales bacterium]
MQQRGKTSTMTARGEFERYAFETGPMENNVYLLVSPQTREAVLIDASDDAERLAEEVSKLRARVRMILLTHGHADHWGALGQLRDTWGVPVGIHLADADMLPLTPNFALDDGQRIGLGFGEIHVLHTPGHTPGGVCFLADGCLFSGDTLFPGGPGATKQPLGDFPLIMTSLREKLFVLPDSTLVLPGHGKSTTIGTERPALDEWQARGW